MLDPACRPFTLKDALILVAATAIGLATIRDVLPGVTEGPQEPINGVPGSWPARLDSAAFLATFWVPIPAGCWAVAVVILRLGRPRPPLGLAFREPGAAACLAGASAFLLLVARLALNQVAGERDSFRSSLISSLVYNAGGPSHAAFGAWLVLVAGGLWEPKAGWLDRLGRAVGASLIAVDVVAYLHGLAWRVYDHL